MRKRITSILLAALMLLSLLPVPSWAAEVTQDEAVTATEGQPSPQSDAIAVTSVPENKYLGCDWTSDIIPANCYVDDDGVYYIADDSGSLLIDAGSGVMTARKAVMFTSESTEKAEVVSASHIPLLVNENIEYSSPATGNKVVTGVNEYRCMLCGKTFYGSVYCYSTPATAVAYNYVYAYNLVKQGYFAIPANAKLANVPYLWTANSGGSSGSETGGDDAPTESITMKWQKKLLVIDDTSKPPYPNGTDAEYATALRAWASSANVRSITADNANMLLTHPVYLPVDTGNGNYMLLSDGATNVRQAIMDIVFLENLKTYADKLDQALAGVKFFDEQKYSGGYSMKQEKEIYREVLGWYPQIQRYLDTRNQDSNIFAASLAAKAYQGLSLLIDQPGSETYKTYLKPYLKAYLTSTEIGVENESLRDYAHYQDYKDRVESMLSAIKNESAPYWATTSSGSSVSIDFDTITKLLQNTGNDTLEQLGKVGEQSKKLYNAVQLSMSLGCTIGLFPFVMDLYSTSYKSASDEVKALYFLADYYIDREYPDVYALLFEGGRAYPVDYDYMMVMQNPSLQQASYTNDPIMYNWIWLWAYREKQWRDDCAGLRRDLTNYAVLLRFARDFDASAAKKALVEYLDAEIHSGSARLGGGGFRCPVTVNVYDTSHTLAASFSSESQTLPDVPGAALYLLGEEKYIVFDPDQYTLEIIPYGSGAMNVQLTDADGQVSVYQDVPVAVGMNISVDMAAEKQLTVDDTANGNGTYTATPETSVPPRSFVLGGSAVMDVGAQQQLTVTAYPVGSAISGLRWSSSAQEIIQVDDSGCLTALMPGSAVITAQDTETGTSAAFAVHAAAVVQSITPTDGSVSLLEGESLLLSVTLQPETVALKDVRWATSDPNVVNVDDSGTIYALTAGEAVITISSGDIEAYVQVTVQAKTYAAGDINGDGIVSILDVACLYEILTTNWYSGQIESEDIVFPLEDFNNDGTVDVYDLQLLYETVSETA